MSEGTYKTDSKHLQFEIDNCHQCRLGMTYEYDHGDGEEKSRYRCKIQKELNDELCDGEELSTEAFFIAIDYALFKKPCPKKKVIAK